MSQDETRFKKGILCRLRTISDSSAMEEAEYTAASPSDVHFNDGAESNGGDSVNVAPSTTDSSEPLLSPDDNAAKSV